MAGKLPKGAELDHVFGSLSNERQAYLTRLLEVSNSQGSINNYSEVQGARNPPPVSTVRPKPKFRFHKNLANSRYAEFLAESDDEDFFKSKPLTKDGRQYELDFKIDTYRDQIRLNKRGSQKKLLTTDTHAGGKILV